MDTQQFGQENEIALFPRLRSAWHVGRDLAALVRGFAIASLGVDTSLLTPLREDLTALRTVGRVKKVDTGSSSSQSELNLEPSTGDPRRAQPVDRPRPDRTRPLASDTGPRQPRRPDERIG